MTKIFNIKKNSNHPIHEKHHEKRLVFKTFICLIYLIVITILVVCIYQLYHEKEKVLPWSEAESVEDCPPPPPSQTSEKFGCFENSKKKIPFVI